MATFKPTKFQIDSSLTLPADGYTADIARSSDFVTASENDRVTLQAGFEVGGIPYFVTLINEGVIDSYYLDVSPDSISVSLQGRDQMAHALDTQISRRYLAKEPAETVSGTVTVEEFVGTYKASSIASDIAALISLKMSWQCRDYTIVDSFDAVGRPFDILQNLVEPWSQFDPLKVDIFLQGDTIICRERSLNPTPDPSLGVFTVRGSRIASIQLRKFKLPLIGKVILSGQTIESTITDTTPYSEWQNSIVYDAGDTVTGPDGTVYVSTGDNNSGHDPTDPGASGYWIEDNPTSGPYAAQDWVATTLYGIGDQVTYAGNPYTSIISNNVGNQPDTSPGAWSAGMLPPPVWNAGTTYQVPDQVTASDSNVYTDNMPNNIGNDPVTGPPTVSGAANIGWDYNGTNSFAQTNVYPNSQVPYTAPGSDGASGAGTNPKGSTKSRSLETTFSTDNIYDATGALITRINTATTTMQPQGIQTLEVKETYTYTKGLGELTTRVTKNSYWENSDSQALQLGETSITEGWITEPSSLGPRKTFSVIQRDQAGFSYDLDRFLTCKGTVTEKIELAKPEIGRAHV